MFYFTLRFLWQTLTSSTSKDTEFCSFSEIWDGFSVKEQRAQYQLFDPRRWWRMCVHLICHSTGVAFSLFPRQAQSAEHVYGCWADCHRLVSWQHKHKQLVKSKICLPSFWKNPVKVNCRCEDKLKRTKTDIGSYQLFQLLILIIECMITEYLASSISAVT